jgi:hypothetical protein
MLITSLVEPLSSVSISAGTTAWLMSLRRAALPVEGNS